MDRAYKKEPDLQYRTPDLQCKPFAFYATLEVQPPPKASAFSRGGTEFTGNEA